MDRRTPASQAGRRNRPAHEGLGFFRNAQWQGPYPLIRMSPDIVRMTFQMNQDSEVFVHRSASANNSIAPIIFFAVTLRKHCFE